MRILLFFQLCLLPLLGERKRERKKEQRPSPGDGVFLLAPHNWLSMCGEENLNYSPCESMAPPMEPKPMRMFLFFSVISTWPCQEREKDFILHEPNWFLKCGSRSPQEPLRGLLCVYRKKIRYRELISLYFNKWTTKKVKVSTVSS